MKLRYTPAAIYDLEEVESYIRDTLLNPEAAAKIVLHIANTCSRLKEQPRLGGELRNKLGREMDGYYLVCNKHIIIYDIDDAISILRILDTRTDYVKALIAELDSKG